jgi:CHAD domain-containing protein
MAKPTDIPGLGTRTRLADAGPWILAARAADVRALEHPVNGRMENDDVHNMRVATRRLRAALGLFGDKRLLRLEREVKRLQDALGRVRDVQVQLKWLQSAGKKPSARSVGGLAKEQRRLLASYQRDLKAELSRWARLGAPAIVKHLPRAGGKGRLGGKAMRRRVLMRLASLEERLNDFRKAPDAEAAHELRIQLKKLRYELELLKPGQHTGASATLAILIPLQDKLGALHDSDVRLELLAGYAARTNDEHQPDVLSWTDEVLKERRDQSAQLAEEVERWYARKTLRRLARLFD